jgi:hypothetical protein
MGRAPRRWEGKNKKTSRSRGLGAPRFFLSDLIGIRGAQPRGEAAGAESVAREAVTGTIWPLCMVNSWPPQVMRLEAKPASQTAE